MKLCEKCRKLKVEVIETGEILCLCNVEDPVIKAFIQHQTFLSLYSYDDPNKIKGLLL